MSAIELSGVTRTFASGTTGGAGVEALASIDLSVASGEFVAVVGPSGCGKSTLLRIIAGLLRPDGGTVRVGGQHPEQAKAAKQFGLVPQAPALLPWRSVLDNVMLPFEVNRGAGAGAGAGGGRSGPGGGGAPRQQATALLETMGLADFLGFRPHQLSGGMQQRVAIARAFAFGPPILLMDEPFAALDEITRAQMRYQLLELWNQQRKTVVFVTHSITEAVVLSDRVAVMSPRPGRIVDVRPVRLPRPRSEQLEDSAAFLAEVRVLRAALREGLVGA